MSLAEPALDRIEQGARDATRQAAPWIEKLARFGYAAHGIVYIVIGILAVQAARGDGEATDSGGALRSIVSQPFGRLLIALVAVGLIGYVIWRFVAAGLNPENDKPAKRAATAVSGLIHAALAVEAVRLAMGGSGAGEGDQASHWTAEVMSRPFGRWLIALVGLVIAGFGLQQLRHAYRVKLDDQLSIGSLSAESRRWVVRAGRAGLAARGVVFAIMGGFLLLAALRTSPGEARGVGGALRSLREQPSGPWLLGIVALGLI
ncbi:MAG: DUF1206 domain-containing protein, partial [Gemmatimonadetes bacterium]|nr:DUF1206 domain-containing protein [Gemmatimonadota bacterium]